MPREYRRAFRVRHYECDLHGHVNNANYLRYMQQAAIEASADAGYASREYRRLGALWLIRETGIEYLHPTLPDEVLEVRTWVADFRRIQSRRRYVMTVAGQPVADAYTDWVYVNRTTQQPVRIPPAMVLAFMPEGGPGEAIQRRPMQAPPAPAGSVRVVHHVEWGDLDNAGHVNNAVYLNFLEESGIRAGEAIGWGMAELAAHRLAVVARSHRIQYLEPGLHGDELEIETWLSDMRRVSALRHYVIRRLGDGATIVRARSRVTILDRELMRPAEIPDAMRRAFSPQTV